jgi:transcriptional antiterminator RfaH
MTPKSTTTSSAKSAAAAGSGLESEVKVECGLYWYCIQTRPAKERRTAAFLGAHYGMEVYFPRIRQRKTIRRVRREVVSPLFPRYLFCRFDAGVHLRAVRYTSEVTSVVSFGGRPAVVADSLIGELKRWAGDEVDLIVADPDFRPGETVEVVDGPMQGLRAVILHAKNDRERVTVLLSLLAAPVQMVIDRSKLSKCV